MKRSIFLGALSALVGMFPAAFLLALVWRFPIPLGGYARGFDQALATPMAVVFYGILGGFIVVPGLGAAVGFLAFMVFDSEPKARKMSILYGLLCSLLFAFFLAGLELLIGPW